MILQYTRNVLLAKGVRNRSTLVLRESNPAMLLIHAQLAVKVTCVCHRLA